MAPPDVATDVDAGARPVGPGSAPDGLRRLQRPPLLVAACVLVLCAVFLLGRAVDGVEATRTLVEPESLEASAQLAEQFSCVDEQLHRRVPPGDRVAVQADDEGWRQRLTEFSFRSNQVVARPADADWVVSVVLPPAGGAAPRSACRGVALTVTAGGR